MSTAVNRTQRAAMEERVTNPNPWTIDFIFGGDSYLIPGKNEYWQDPVTGERYFEPGVMPVRPRGCHITYELDGDNILRKLAEKRVTVDEMLNFMLGEDRKSGKLGRAGVRLLDNWDETVSDALKAEGAKVAAEKAYADACATISVFEFLNRKTVDAGGIGHPPNAKQREAYRLKADYERSDASDFKTMPFQCPRCYERFAEMGALQTHIHQIHASDAAELMEKVSEPKRGPGRPRKQAVEAVQPDAAA